MRIAAVGDLHCRADTRRNVAVALRGVDQEADVLLLAGDLTDHGTREEANWLAEEPPVDQGEIVRYRYLSRSRPSFASARASGPTRIIFADVAGSRAAIHLSVWLAQMENMGRLRAFSAARHQVTWA